MRLPCQGPHTEVPTSPLSHTEPSVFWIKLLGKWTGTQGALILAIQFFSWQKRKKAEGWSCMGYSCKLKALAVLSWSLLYCCFTKELQAIEPERKLKTIKWGKAFMLPRAIHWHIVNLAFIWLPLSDSPFESSFPRGILLGFCQKNPSPKEIQVFGSWVQQDFG